MTNNDIEVARQATSALAVSAGQRFWNDEQIAALRQLGIENAPNGDLAVFLNYAQRTGLDPFARQIYMIGRRAKQGDNWTTKWTIQASIDGLRIVAERSGDYAGQTAPEFCGEDGVWRDVWTSHEPPVAARVGVFRRGFTQALYGVAYFDEYVQLGRDGKPAGMWSKPRIMLAKCAEAVALRKAFPNDLSGIYTADEMAQADNHTVQSVVPAEIIKAEVVEPINSETFVQFMTALSEAKTIHELNMTANEIKNAELTVDELARLLRNYHRMLTVVATGDETK